MVEVYRFWSNGWIDRYYIRPEFFFHYYGFEWIGPWAGSGMYWHFALIAILALLITLGAFYRLAAIVFLFAFTYVFLLDQARYLNHFVLVILIAFLIVVVPAQRAYSVDAALAGRPQNATVPTWSIWLFRLQFELLYIFAGVVKINPDWLRLEPMGMWMARRADFPLIGPLFTEDWFVALIAYSVIVLHIVGAPLLLFRRTRIYVVAVYFVFHVTNHFFFRIGIFPWLAIAATMLFFDPDWPRQLASHCRRWAGGAPATKTEATNG
ncbi:MAG: HTTM domain-containing protein [Gammaproteobacteria bacterium]